MGTRTRTGPTGQERRVASLGAAVTGACVLAGAGQAGAAEYSYGFTYNATAYTNKVWFDDSLTAGGVRGTIVVFDYGNAGGLYTSAAWRNFATEKRLALTLMVSQDTFGDPNTGVYNTAAGLGVLSSTLSSAATQSGVSSLGSSTLPYVFAGVSRGGTAGAIAWGWQAGANRTVAAIGYHGNSFNYLTNPPPSAAASIPVLYPMAQLDPTGAVTTRQGDIETAVRTGSVVPSIGTAYGYRPTRGLYWTTTMQYGASHSSTGDDTYPLQWLRRAWDTRINPATPGTLSPIQNATSLSGAYTLSNANTTNAAFTSLTTGTFTQRDTRVWVPGGGGADWLAESAANTAGTQRTIDTAGGTFYVAPDTVQNRAFTGVGTLTFTGTGLVQLDSTGGTNAVAMSQGVGGTIVVTRGATLRNGPTNGVNWTNNLASLTVDAGSTLDVWNGTGVRVDALGGAGSITLGVNGTANWAGARTFTFGAGNGSGTFDGVISGNPTTLGGTLSVVKLGTGTQILTGTQTYSGTTTVSGGTLAVTGSLANNGPASIVLAATSATLADNPALVRRRAIGASYAGFGATASGGLGTAIVILGGTNAGGTDDAVGMRFRLRSADESGGQSAGAAFPGGGGLGSEVISLTGMTNDGTAAGRSDPFVLQMTYSEPAMAAALGVTLTGFQAIEATLASMGRLRLGTLTTAGAWAGAGDSAILRDAAPTMFYVGAWSAAGSPLTVGSFGIDPAANTAWAVVDYNGQFAVLGQQFVVIPEPTGAAPVAAGGVLLARRRRRRA